MQAAAAHEQYGVLHFPHNLDFRGRAYPMSPHLSHMGNDLCRGLLTFADARPLGQHGFRWLLIHLANLFGEVDKRSFDERVEWALRKLPEVVDSAEAPLGGRRWWLQGEAPWSVLATCMDIAAAVAHGDVASYESRLPVHQDGSCNGLQHYAAMGRDLAGAQAVCLVDAPAPDDVYTKVMEQVSGARHARFVPAGVSLLPPHKGKGGWGTIRRQTRAGTCIPTSGDLLTLGVV